MTYRGDVGFLENCTPELIERNAAEFARMRDLLDSAEPAVLKAGDIHWESQSRETYDERLKQVRGLVQNLADGFWQARNALLRYADEVGKAKEHLRAGIRHESELARLVSSVTTSITVIALNRTAQAAEPMKRWEDIRSTNGFLDWIAELAVDENSVREDADRAYEQAEAAFGQAQRVEENARRDCLAKLTAAYQALPEFRGGRFAHDADLGRRLAPLLEEAARAAREPHAQLPGGEGHKNPFPVAGDQTVSPALQDIRSQLQSLPAGDSNWLMDKLSGQRRFIESNRELIGAAAKSSGLPPDMVAGIAWMEAGGKPYVLDDVTSSLREAARSELSPVIPENLPGPLAGDRDSTSYGPMAIQTRRAAEVLGYDPARLTDGQREEIRTSLKDPAQNILIAAKYLANLKAESGFADVPADRMTPGNYRELAARYNGGPYWQVPQAQAYADDFETHRGEAGRALR